MVTVFGENLDCPDDRLRVAVFLPFCLPGFIIQHHEMASLRGLEPPTRGLGNRCSVQLSYSDEMGRSLPRVTCFLVRAHPKGGTVRRGTWSDVPESNRSDQLGRLGPDR